MDGVGKLVRDRRVALGLTQTELALKSGLRQTYISQVEKGDIAIPRDHNLDALGKALGLSRPDFFRAAGMMDDIIESDQYPIDFDAEAIRELLAQPGVRNALARARAQEGEAGVRATIETIADVLGVVLRARERATK